MHNNSEHVCPMACAGAFDNRVRRWFQHPRKLLGPYIREGMTVLDVGCGPGFFTLEMARMVGASGRVIAVDLQEGMLRIIREKIQGTALEARITLQRTQPDSLGVSSTPVDFALAFYMVHEVPDQARLLREIATLLTPHGQLLIVEPPFHVSKQAFATTVSTAEDAGLTLVARPKMRLSMAALLQKG